MTRSFRLPAALALGGLLLVAPSCKKAEAPKPAEPATTQPAPPPPLAVASINLGKAIGPDKAVTAAATTFAVRDTIYASVATAGAGENATIAAKWSFVKAGGAGTVPVNESSQTISSTGQATLTEFHIVKATPWPKGKYSVEILLNGVSAGTREFDVQ